MHKMENDRLGRLGLANMLMDLYLSFILRKPAMVS